MNPLKIAGFLISLLVLVFLFNKRGKFSVLLSENTTELPESLNIEEPADSLRPGVLLESAGKMPDSVLMQIGNLEMANQKALFAFFTKLQTTHDTLVRIIYYGDSQIERDFITHTFRKKLQELFGGAGPGYVPAGMYFNNAEGIDIISSDFKSHSLLYKNGKANFGLYGKYFLASGTKVQIKIKSRRVENFHRLNIFYHGTGNLKLNVDGKTLHHFALNDTIENYFTTTFPATPGIVRLTFDSNAPIVIDGLTLDPLKGIVVDQVAFRGNLNLMAHKINAESYITMAHEMNIGLLVLHFGLNAIPDKRSTYNDYQRALERDISLLKSWVPDASVLVIGASDMACRSEGELKAYPNIDALIEAQRNAAIGQGAAFWNMRKAMGGQGAIIQWVEAQQARSDFAHLTKKGGEIIGEQLYFDLMEAYNQYLERDD